MNYRLPKQIFQPDESYNQILQKSIEHSRELQEILLAMQQSYPLGHLNRRELHKARKCILCAIDSLL